MDKMKLHTPDLTEANIARLAELFPNCVTESRDPNGRIKPAVDFDLLRQELSGAIVEGPQERYQLNWPGKREALLIANAPIAKTLRPCREESVNFDTTQNLYIEGDNLDALKLLQETYLGKVKMIYIDPPYNTGNDFIYDDDFAEDTESYKLRSNQTDEQGNRLVANTEANGRFHSDWLSMIYPRLKLARNFLRDDGVVFISIDDNEIHNIRKACDEIFGESNFVANIIWQSRISISDDHEISMNHNHTIIYSKSYEAIKFYGEKLNESEYKNRDNDPRGPWKLVPLDANKPGGNTNYPILNVNTGVEHYPPDGRSWAINPREYNKLYEDNRISFGINGDSSPKKKLFLLERLAKGDTKTPSSILLDAGTTKDGTEEVAILMGKKKIFSYPKPTAFISRLIQYGLYQENNQIVLDFFSGSATTAHAVMKLNAEDGGNRKFIMVQLPEPCDPKFEAYKAGYATIAEIGKERIRRAGQKIRQDNADKPGIAQLDIGFRVLKVDTSNMEDTYYAPDALDNNDLYQFVENIRPDRSEEDLLFQVLLDWGVDLTLPVTRETIAGLPVLFVDGNALAACFSADGAIDEAFVRELATRHPLRVVFRDAGFADDNIKINIEQIFSLLSPATEIRTL